jgi:hypothetical protein
MQQRDAAAAQADATGSSLRAREAAQAAAEVSRPLTVTAAHLVAHASGAAVERKPPRSRPKGPGGARH